jgi:hypothetical protein
MKPDLRGRRVVEVLAGVAWNHTLKHRIYSCPDTPQYEFSRGATALILKGANGRRVSLEINSVITLAADHADPAEGLPESLRVRLRDYRAAVLGLPGILNPGVAHRFYFLSEEPWPTGLQLLTTPAQCPDAEWNEILSICTDPNHYFEWPRTGMLLWPGCVRPDVDEGDEPHHYPEELEKWLHRCGLHADRRSNGPAIMAFLATGGRRPIWGSEGWPIHHIYDGTGALPGGPQDIPHAVHDGRYFTQSAGLVAAHPVAQDLAHRSDLLKWLLRREAFLRFGFDPCGAFAPP